MLTFWRDGFKETSVKALSERLGITRSSFYNAFGSQEAVFLEALERYLARSPDRAFAEVPQSSSICGLITATFKVICQTLGADPEAKGCLAVNSVSALCNVEPELGPKVAAHMNVRRERIETLLNVAVARGELPGGFDVSATALALKALIVGLNSMSKVLPDRSALWPAARSALVAFGLLCEHDEPAESSCPHSLGEAEA